MNPSLLDKIPGSYEGGEIKKVGFIYVVIAASVRSKPYSFDEREKWWNACREPPTGKGYKTAEPDTSSDRPSKWSSVILAGLDGHNVQHVLTSDFVETSDRIAPDMATCRIGLSVAKQLNVHPGYVLNLRGSQFATTCYVSTVESFGGSEDSQIFTDWYTGQRLAGLPKRLSIIQLSVPGTAPQIQSFIAALQQRFPDVDVRPIRQFTEGEAIIYNRISGLLTATVGIVLVLTGLCVMAPMTNLPMERRNDLRLMKAIGGSGRRVRRLFRWEAACV